MAKMVEIDTPECIGCQSCVELCPEVFAFDDTLEKAYVVFDEGGESHAPARRPLPVRPPVFISVNKRPRVKV